MNGLIVVAKKTKAETVRESDHIWNRQTKQADGVVRWVVNPAGGDRLRVKHACPSCRSIIYWSETVPMRDVDSEPPQKESSSAPRRIKCNACGVELTGVIHNKESGLLIQVKRVPVDDIAFSFVGLVPFAHLRDTRLIGDSYSPMLLPFWKSTSRTR